ncbi:MAG: ribosome-associated translation inhibitor RaiA [Acidimicrobiia bacterium]|nr:ribosome-associated translation inhibitor RaiA [Acidimicrobiia bacterium]
MKVTYTGKIEKLSPPMEKKLTARYAKLAKFLDRGAEKEAHVILTAERHKKRAEVTVNYYDHPLVGTDLAADSFTALMGAIDKLEKQVRRHQSKWRDTKRGEGKGLKAKVMSEIASVPAETRKRVFRVNSRSKHKPMSLDEALLTIGDKRDYLVYRDLETDRISVLLRRNDGNFDLVEA